MDYELVKQLKDAGFPQYLTKDSFIYIDGVEIIHNTDLGTVTVENPELVKVPSLSELIEACGDEFDTLYKGRSASFSYPEQDGKWYCNASHNEANYSIYGGIEGLSPEEAVAHLWLELNKKQ